MCTGSEAGSSLKLIHIVSLNSRLESNKEEEEECPPNPNPVWCFGFRVHGLGFWGGGYHAVDGGKEEFAKADLLGGVRSQRRQRIAHLPTRSVMCPRGLQYVPEFLCKYSVNLDCVICARGMQYAPEFLC